MRREPVLLTLTKSLRSFIFVTMAVSSPYYLSHYEYDSLEIGTVLFLSILSTSIFVIFYGKIRKSLRFRSILLSSLLIIGFIILLVKPDPLFYIAGIIIGGISLSGRDLSAYQPIEQYTISHYETDQNLKNRAFSIYNFGSYGAASLGTLFLFLFGSRVSFMAIFFLDLCLAIAQMALYIFVAFPHFEADGKKPEIPIELKSDVSTLTALFSMDAIGGGLITTSILTLWFKAVYNVDLSLAGFIFLVVNILTAISILISSRIQNSIGLIRTMVFTHLVSNGFLLFMPIIHNLLWSEIFLYLRQTTSQMDVPARDSFINTFIPKEERISANSRFTSARSASQIPGPLLGGLAIEIMPSSLIFAAGGIKAIYDLILYKKYSWFRT
ncbi:MAG: MFS transporter [Candidatus Thermoplasmatota archaeon]|nr:MFS transporter [Candidatus Thermoplasmatota archaeon]